MLFHRLGGDEVIDCLDAAKGTRHWRFRYAAPYEDDLGKGDGRDVVGMDEGDFALARGGAQYAGSANGLRPAERVGW